MEKYKELFDRLFTSINDRLLVLEEENDKKEVLQEKVRLLNVLVECFQLTDYAAIGVELDNISKLLNQIFPGGEYNQMFRDLVKNVNAFNTYISKESILYSDEIRRIIIFINNFKMRLINELIVLESDLKKFEKCDKNDIIKYKNILRSFECGCPLTELELEMLSKDIIEKEFSFDDQIRLFENIKMFNSNSVFDDNSVSILNMVDFGYEKIELPTLNDSDKKRFSFIVGGYSSLINSSMFDFEEFSKDVVLDDKNYSLGGFTFILDSLLLMLQDKIYEVSSFYDEKGFYLDENLRNACVEEFNKYIELYNVLRNYRDNSVDLYQSNKYEESLDNVDVVNNLYFAFPGEVNQDSFSYFERDLKDVPEEYLSKIGKYLYELKIGEISKGKLKQFNNNNNFKGLREIKDDQIRIVLKHISCNNYLVVGVFVKKDNNDKKQYQVMGDRRVAIDLNNPLMSIEVEKRIISYINDNKRVSSR